MNYQKLFNHMSGEHGVALLETEMQEIVNIVREMDKPIIDCMNEKHYGLPRCAIICKGCLKNENSICI